MEICIAMFQYNSVCIGYSYQVLFDSVLHSASDIIYNKVESIIF